MNLSLNASLPACRPQSLVLAQKPSVRFGYDDIKVRGGASYDEPVRVRMELDDKTQKLVTAMTAAHASVGENIGKGISTLGGDLKAGLLALAQALAPVNPPHKDM